MCRSALVILASLLRLAPPAVAGDEVDLSRYQLSVAVAVAPPSPQKTFVPVDQGVFVAFCGDKDGCTVRLRLETIYGVRGVESLVYLSSGLAIPGSWSTDFDTAFHYDLDFNAEKANEVVNNMATCFLWDGETAAIGSDSALGFSLVATNTDTVSTATCVLVVID
jgi:hypothetical protein